MNLSITPRHVLYIGAQLIKGAHFLQASFQAFIL